MSRASSPEAELVDVDELDGMGDERSSKEWRERCGERGRRAEHDGHGEIGSGTAAEQEVQGRVSFVEPPDEDEGFGV